MIRKKRPATIVTNPLADEAVRRRILHIFCDSHARIVRDVRSALSKFARRDRDHYEKAMAVHGPGAGDIRYKIDVVAERAVERMARDLGKIVDCRVLSEGTGEILTSGRDPLVRVLVDPIDGTRNIMADLRPAWVLTGAAAEDGARLLTTEDLAFCLQSEIPTSYQSKSVVLYARRGAGCYAQYMNIPSGDRSEPARIFAPKNLDLKSGYYVFLKYLPRERAAIAEFETTFFSKCRLQLSMDTSRVYDDQWISAAGQLFLTLSGRSRMFADTRGWLAAKAGVETVASHPYDLCSYLIASESGSPVFQFDKNGELEPFRAPLDLETNVSMVAFANERARKILGPILTETLRTKGTAAAARLRKDYKNETRSR